MSIGRERCDANDSTARIEARATSIFDMWNLPLPSRITTRDRHGGTGAGSAAGRVAHTRIRGAAIARPTPESQWSTMIVDVGGSTGGDYKCMYGWMDGCVGEWPGGRLRQCLLCRMLLCGIVMASFVWAMGNVLPTCGYGSEPVRGSGGGRYSP